MCKQMAWVEKVMDASERGGDEDPKDVVKMSRFGWFKNSGAWIRCAPHHAQLNPFNLNPSRG